jgi:AcrR family transcriptional regulator
MEPTAPAKLGRQDWLMIGIETLIDQGIESVRVDPLAKLLKVTRGSFYWHFKNRDELLEGILLEWEARNTQSVIDRLEGLDNDPNAKLLSLFAIAAADDDRLEKAVRVWSFSDTRAADAIARVDRQRLDYLESLFSQLGFSAIDAKVRAQVVYSIRLGWFVMATAVDPVDRLTEINLVHRILTQADRS